MALLNGVTMRNRRTLLLLAPFCVALLGHAVGCSAMLDTDSLQAGSGGASGAGAGGEGGTAPDGGDAEASDDGSDGGAEADAGKPCRSDLDCEDGDSCTADRCDLPDGGTSGFCRASKPWTGLAIEPNPKHPQEDVVLTADDIGLPMLAGDDQNTVLAAWYRSNGKTDVKLRSYKENASLGSTETNLSSVLGTFEGFGASPGMRFQILPRRIRLVFPGDPTGVSGMGMFQWDLDPDQLQASQSQPTAHDLQAAGYDTAPELAAPRLFWDWGQLDEIAMWLQKGQLWVHDTTNGSQAVFTSKKVTGFTPLLGKSGEHAALMTDDTTSGPTTEIWTRGTTSLTQVASKQPGDLPLGIASTTITEGNYNGNPLNVITYAYMGSSKYPIVESFAAVCDATSCTSGSLPSGQGAQPSVGMFPTIDSSPTPSAKDERDLALSIVLPFDDANDATMTDAALVGSALHVTTSGLAVDEKPINPPQFAIGAATLPKASKAIPIAQTALFVTPTRQVFFAWVERGASSATLKVRRYQIRSCQ